MSEAINNHKRMAMHGMEEANHLKTGGVVKKFADGGSVNAYPEKGIDKLPAKGVKPKMSKPVPHAIATMKNGGGAKRSSGRGR